jgi:serine/threonine protein kinase
MPGLEGQILGGCRIIRRLGAGGMGQVYLAEQIRLKREVALKVVRPPRSRGSDEGGGGALADAPERFKLEARAIAALEHPNILQVHEFGAENDLMYLVMPYMPDGSLFDAMRPGGSKRRLTLPIEPAKAAPIIFQAASALEYAHRHNIIHRDVKPENFLVRYDRDGKMELFLADFGLVKEYHPGSNTNTLAVGTADYVAPEQIEGHPVPASDQYALAVMTYELLVGRLPFTGAVAEVALKHLRETPPPPRSLNPAIPEEIEQVILRALRKKPQDRWPSVMEYARAYSEVLKKLERRSRAKDIESEKTLPSMSPASQPAKPAVSAQAASSPPAVRSAPPASPQQQHPPDTAGVSPAASPARPQQNYPAPPRAPTVPPPLQFPSPWASHQPGVSGGAPTPWQNQPALPPQQPNGQAVSQDSSSSLKMFVIAGGVVLVLAIIAAVIVSRL